MKFPYPSLTQGAQLLHIEPVNEKWSDGDVKGVAFLFHFTGSMYGASVVSKQRVSRSGKVQYGITYGADCNQFEIAHVTFEELPDVTNVDTFKCKLTRGIDVVGHKHFWEVPEVLLRMQNRDFSDFAALGSSDNITDLTLRDAILRTVHFYAWSDQDAEPKAAGEPEGSPHSIDLTKSDTDKYKWYDWPAEDLPEDL